MYILVKTSCEYAIQENLWCSGGSKGGLVGPWLPRFLAAPLLGPSSFVLNFTFKFIWLTYTADHLQPAAKF